MNDVKKKSGATITSIDGKRTISVEEFDQLFDGASDEIDAFIDWSKARMVGGALELRIGRADEGTIADARRKIPRDAAE